MIVHVVGAGLIGTSIGLALRDTAEVMLSDPRADHVDTAVARGAGRRWDGGTADLLVACVPPAAVAPTLADAVAGGRAAAYTHVSSVQSTVQAALETAGVDVSLVCGSHPLAGRERSGPAAATATLFADRPWVLCPSARTSDDVRRAVHDLAVGCGAVPVETSPDEHDRTVALVSHLPQVAASAVAARLDGAASLDLAGPGVQDTTRIAASDPALWVDVLTANASRVEPLVRALADDLVRVADALADPQDPAVLRDLLERGNRGRAHLPVKSRAADLVPVVVSVADSPGQLAGLLVTAAEADVNVEDVRVEHLSGRPRGLVELLVRGGDVERAATALSHAGWQVVGRG